MRSARGSRDAVAASTLWFAASLVACGGSAHAPRGATTGAGGMTGAGAAATGSGGGPGTGGSDGGGGGASVTADFFVAIVGDDTWSGTLAAPNAGKSDGPFATLGKAHAAVRAVDKTTRTTPIVVDVRGGTYPLAATLAFTAMDSGTVAAPVVYQAYPGETPIVSGGKQLTGWTAASAGVYTAQAPTGASFEQLWVNGERRYRPRANAGQYQRIVSAVAASPLDTFQMVKATDLSASWHDLSAVEVIVFEQWTVSRMRLVSVDAASATAKTTPFTSSESWHGFIANHRYLVENVKEALGSAGDWYLDRATSELTYVAEPGEDPSSNAEVTMPALDQILTADGLAETTFRGLTFSYSNWVVPAAGYPAGQGLWNVPAALLVQDPVHVVFDGCTIAHVGSTAIDFQGNAGWSATAADPYSAEFVNGAIFDTGAGAIRVGQSSASSDATTAQGIHIANNVVSGGGRFLNSGQAILVGESHHDVIENNEIFDYYQTAISVGACFAQGPDGGVATYPKGYAHDDVVSHNLIHDIGRGVTNDMGGIYTLTCDTQNTAVTGNVIHDMVHDPGGNGFAVGYGANGIYFDQGTSNVVTTDNLVYRVTGNGFQQNFGRANTLSNNVFAYARNAGLDHTFYESTSLLWVTFDHNIVAYDHGTLLGYDWHCPPGDCTGWANLDDNLYWNSASGGSVVFPLQTPAGNLTLAQWQSMEGEDTGSKVADPLFTAPTPPTDDFSLPGNSPALALGFTALDPTLAGRTSKPITPPTVPAAVPLQEPADPATYY